MTNTPANLGTWVDRHTMRFERRLPVDLDTVWRAVSDARELGHWFMETEWEPRVGGRFEFKHGWGGTIGVWEPKHAIQFDAEAGGSTRFELTTVEEKTLFAIIDRLSPTQTVPQHVLETGSEIACRQSGGPGTHWVGLAAGWHGFVDALQSNLQDATDSPEFQTLVRLYDGVLEDQFS